MWSAPVVSAAPSCTTCATSRAKLPACASAPNTRVSAMQPDAANGKFRCEATLERRLRARGFHAVAGVDEVGRGALFGPVFAGAVILSDDRPIRGLNDSKLIDPERREVLAERIRERAVSWSVAAVDSATIDHINIYQASR